MQTEFVIERGGGVRLATALRELWDAHMLMNARLGTVGVVGLCKIMVSSQLDSICTSWQPS